MNEPQRNNKHFTLFNLLQSLPVKELQLSFGVRPAWWKVRQGDLFFPDLIAKDGSLTAGSMQTSERVFIMSYTTSPEVLLGKHRWKKPLQVMGLLA